MGVVVALLVGLVAVVWWSGWGRETPIGRVVSNVAVALGSAAAGVLLLLPPASTWEVLVGIGLLGYALYGVVHTVPLWRAAGRERVAAEHDQPGSER